MCHVWGCVYHIVDMSKVRRNSFQASWMLIVFYKFWLLRNYHFQEERLPTSASLNWTTNTGSQPLSMFLSFKAALAYWKLSIYLKSGLSLLCSIKKIEPQLENKFLLAYTLAVAYLGNLFETIHTLNHNYLFKIVCILFLFQLYNALCGID